MTASVRSGRGPTLIGDALTTIATRFGLAVLIFSTDVVLAHLLGPAAKGRFTLVLLFSQFAALVVPVPRLNPIQTLPSFVPAMATLLYFGEYFTWLM